MLSVQVKVEIPSVLVIFLMKSHILNIFELVFSELGLVFLNTEEPLSWESGLPEFVVCVSPNTGTM